MAEEMLPTPSVGRMVHYKESNRCIAAIITAVFGGSVTLEIHPPMVHAWSDTGMEQGTENGEWHWPERV